MKNEAVKISHIATWEEAERAMAELAREESERRLIQAEIDRGVAAVHTRYKGRMEEEDRKSVV